MYGGLFGDLPSAKRGGGNDDGGKNIQRDESKSNAGGTVQQPPTDLEQTKQPSILAALGSKGTSMSFMPTALRQRKRPGPSTIMLPSAKAPTLLKEPHPTVVQRINITASVKNHAEEVLKITTNPTSPVPNLEIESEELRELHANVTDPYDPHFPNDLQAYWNRKAAEKQRFALEREARETLERQQRLRDELTQERLNLEKKGDLSDIVKNRVQMSMGRGRGRGVSNLPAWVIVKQQEEARLGSAQVDDSMKRTVILSNLTAPGQVDDDLCDEVKEECEEKCGTVEMVHAKDANPPTQPAVEVIVRFHRDEDAEKAVLLFHGRLFGQRRITAKRLG